jgi:hypothetical protein
MMAQHTDDRVFDYSVGRGVHHLLLGVIKVILSSFYIPPYLLFLSLSLSFSLFLPLSLSFPLFLSLSFIRCGMEKSPFF